MASVWCLPNLTVTVNEVDEYGIHHPVPSNQICAASATWTKHAIVVKRSTRFAIGLTFDLNAQPRSHIFIGDFVEVGLQFDGFRVAHRRIPADEIVALGGRYVFDHFVDGSTGAVRAAEIRPIERGNEVSILALGRMTTDKSTAEGTDEEDYEDAVLRAQRLGKIEVTVAHGKGTMFARGYDAASALPNIDTLPGEILSRINATHYIQYVSRFRLGCSVTDHVIQLRFAKHSCPAMDRVSIRRQYSGWRDWVLRIPLWEHGSSLSSG